MPLHLIRNRIFLSLLLILLCGVSSAQNLQGLVLDQDGSPVPFVTVKVEGSRQGTVTDDAGKFNLPVLQNRSNIVFSHLGYRQDTISISLPYSGLYVHTLTPDFYSIDIVEIEAGKKDPAYAIMKQVIEHKKDHRNGPDLFTCASYVKSVLITDDSTLWEPPKELIFMGIDLREDRSRNKKKKDEPASDSTSISDSTVVFADTAALDTAIVDTTPPGPTSPYMSTFVEMMRTTHYRAPREIKTIVDGYRDFQNRSAESGGIMISFDGGNASEDYRTELQNPLLFIPKYPGADLGFYQNLVAVYELGDRPFVSPLHSTLWQIIYKYRLVSREYVNGRVVFEIEITPRNPDGPYFSGTLWVVDREWALSKVDLSIQKAGLNVFNQFQFQHTYQKNQASGDWLLIEENYEYVVKDGKTLLRGTTFAEHKAYDLSPSFSKNFFRNEILRTDAEAFEKDSSYWETIRPYKLNALEETFVVKQDSIKTIQASDDYIRYQDSIYNRLGWRDIIFEGISYLDRGHGMRYFVDPLVSQPRPFGVGGYRHAFGGAVVKTWDRQKQLNVRPNINYGFNNKDLKGGARIGFLYDPRHFGRAYISAGDIYSTITTFTSIGAILSRSNFINKRYIGFGHTREIVNGLMLDVRFDFADFQAIDQLQLAEWGNELFGELNIPTEFDPFRQFMTEIRLTYTPFQKYVMEPFRKVNLPSPWPTFRLIYRQAIPGIFGSSINWSNITFVADQEIRPGGMGISRWRMRAGTFPIEGNLRFTDYTFFRGSDPYFFANPLRAFQLLGPTLSTPNEYVEAHYIHDFGGALMQKVPLLKKLPLHLAGGAGTLYIRDQNFLHSEVFAGIGVPIRIKADRLKISAYYVTSYSNYDAALAGQWKFGISFYDPIRKRWSY